MKKIKILWFFLLFAGFMFSCRESKVRESAAESAMRQQLLRFFTAPASAPGNFSGLWLAEQSSLEKAIEKRYLSQYQAQPDEASREVLRDRLKGIRTYLRIEQNSVEMLTFSPEGGVGANIGDLTVQGKQGKLRLRGKDTSTTVVAVAMRESSGSEVIEYREEGNLILFYREQRPAEELTQEIMARMQNMLALPEY